MVHSCRAVPFAVLLSLLACDATSKVSRNTAGSARLNLPGKLSDCASIKRGKPEATDRTLSDLMGKDTTSRYQFIMGRAAVADAVDA